MRPGTLVLLFGTQTVILIFFGLDLLSRSMTISSSQFYIAKPFSVESDPAVEPAVCTARLPPCLLILIHLWFQWSQCGVIFSRACEHPALHP